MSRADSWYQGLIDSLSGAIWLSTSKFVRWEREFRVLKWPTFPNALRSWLPRKVFVDGGAPFTQFSAVSFSADVEALGCRVCLVTLRPGSVSVL